MVVKEWVLWYYLSSSLSKRLNRVFNSLIGALKGLGIGGETHGVEPLST